MSESRLRAAMSDLEQANKRAERCRLEWLISQSGFPASIDPFVSEAYCIAANEAALAGQRYLDAMTESQAEYLRGDMEVPA